MLTLVNGHFLKFGYVTNQQTVGNGIADIRSVLVVINTAETVRLAVKYYAVV